MQFASAGQEILATSYEVWMKRGLEVFVPPELEPLAQTSSKGCHSSRQDGHALQQGLGKDAWFPGDENLDAGAGCCREDHDPVPLEAGGGCDYHPHRALAGLGKVFSGR